MNSLTAITERDSIDLPDGYKINDLAPSAVEWTTTGDGISLADSSQKVTIEDLELRIPVTLADIRIVDVQAPFVNTGHRNPVRRLATIHADGDRVEQQRRGRPSPARRSCCVPSSVSARTGSSS